MAKSLTDPAREKFKKLGLSYSDVTEGDICILVMLLNKAMKEHKKIQPEMGMRLSQKIKSKFLVKTGMQYCYIKLHSSYFKDRECISFNEDSFIGFCGWADECNTRPIVGAFMEWCDYLKSDKVLTWQNA